MTLLLQPPRFGAVGMKEHENGHTETDLPNPLCYKNGHKQMGRLHG